MDENLMKVWVDAIWLKHSLAECKRLGFQNSMLSFDSFASHLTDGVKAQLLEDNFDLFAIAVGCISKS